MFLSVSLLAFTLQLIAIPSSTSIPLQVSTHSFRNDSSMLSFVPESTESSTAATIGSRHIREARIGYGNGYRNIVTEKVRPEVAYQRNRARQIFTTEVKQQQALRKQPDFLIPEGSRKAIEISVARSGSTLLLNVFSVIKNSFVLPEPYNMFAVNVTQSKLPKAIKPPTVESLFDCSFVPTPAVDYVFWEYACRNMPWVVRESLLALCKANKLSLKMISERCVNAPLHLLKIVRIPFLTNYFQTQNILPQDAKVFNLVRLPWDVFMSQYKAGWFTDPQLPFVAMLPVGANVFEFNMDRICNETLLNREITMMQSPSNRMFIRYEDMMGDFIGTITRLFEFLDIPLTPPMLDVIQEIRERKFAAFTDILQSQMKFTRTEAKQLALSLPSCKSVLTAFRYF